MTHRSLIPLTLVGCACAGCGSGGPKGPVARAADASLRQASEHVQLSGTLTAPAVLVSASGGGDFQNDPDQGRFNASFQAGSTSGPLTIVVADKVLYASSPAFADSLPGDWVSFKLGKAGKPAAKAFGPLATQTPVGMFGELRRSHGLTTVGAEAVAGRSTTHYRVTAPTRGYGPVDVWVGDDGLIYQVASVYMSSSGRTAATVVFSGYGEPVAVTPPAGDSLDLTDDAVKSLRNGGRVAQ